MAASSAVKAKHGWFWDRFSLNSNPQPRDVGVPGDSECPGAAAAAEGAHGVHGGLQEEAGRHVWSAGLVHGLQLQPGNV